MSDKRASILDRVEHDEQDRHRGVPTALQRQLAPVVVVERGAA